ncbi:unnamed protein product, partial [Adineta steineri]
LLVEVVVDVDRVVVCANDHIVIV